MRAFLEAEEASPLGSWGVPLPALWLTPQEERLSALDVGLLRRVFPDHRCYVWSVSDGGAASPAMKKMKRAFGNWPELGKSVVAKNEMVCGQVLFYCDVASVEPECDRDVAELASGTLWGKRSGLFMSSKPVEHFPEDLLSLCRIGIECSGKRCRTESEGFLRRYLEGSAAMGTIPLLVGEDSNSRQFLVAPGQDHIPKDVLVAAATRQEFDAWLRIGVDLRILT